MSTESACTPSIFQFFCFSAHPNEQLRGDIECGPAQPSLFLFLSSSPCIVAFHLLCHRGSQEADLSVCNPILTHLGGIISKKLLKRLFIKKNLGPSFSCGRLNQPQSLENNQIIRLQFCCESTFIFTPIWLVNCWLKKKIVKVKRKQSNTHYTIFFGPGGLRAPSVLACAMRSLAIVITIVQSFLFFFSLRLLLLSFFLNFFY